MIANFMVDIWTGDMGALMLLFAMLLPFVLAYAAIQAIIDKVRGK